MSEKQKHGLRKSVSEEARVEEKPNPKLATFPGKVEKSKIQKKYLGDFYKKLPI